MKRLFILLMIIWSVQISAYDEMDLQRFNALKKCPVCDLSGADLSGIFLLRDTDLRKANLRGANLERSKFVGGTLAGADLTGANLTRVRFGQMYFPTDLSYADLTDVIIDKTDFQYAILCNTKTPWGIENIGCN